MNNEELDSKRLLEIIQNYDVDKLSIIKPSIFTLAVDLIAKTLKKDKSHVYEKVGKYFAIFLVEKTPDRMFVLGRNIVDFMNNFYEMKTNINRLLPQIDEDANYWFVCYEESHQNYILQVKCSDFFYQNIFLGFVQQCNSMVFNRKPKCVLLKPWDPESKIFSIRIIQKIPPISDTSNFEPIPASSLDDLLDKPFIDKAIPCYVLFDCEGVILELGSILEHRLSHIIKNQNITFSDAFQIVHPQLDINIIEDIKKYVNISIIIKPKPNILQSDTVASNCVPINYNDVDFLQYYDFKIKGQLTFIEENHTYWFIGYPHFNDINQLYDNGFYISDLPIQNGARDVIILLNGINHEKNYSEKLSVLTTKLKKIKHDLASECIKTEEIIRDIYPNDFSSKLINGSSINAVSYKEIVILCSDLVAFTSYSNNHTPIEIISLLKTVFGEFDSFCSQYNLTKIETSGDGYMIAAGIQCKGTKFSRIIKCALKMIDTVSSQKMSPEHKIKIRIGVYSGPVIAGIVGLRSPRFCIFGTTVHYATKLEQTAPADMIHISKNVYKNIKFNKVLKIAKMSKWEKASNHHYEKNDPLNITYIIQPSKKKIPANLDLDVHNN